MDTKCIWSVTAFIATVSYLFNLSPLPFISNKGLNYEIKTSLWSLLCLGPLITLSIYSQNSIIGLVLLQKRHAIPYESFFEVSGPGKEIRYILSTLGRKQQLFFPFFFILFFSFKKIGCQNSLGQRPGCFVASFSNWKYLHLIYKVL